MFLLREGYVEFDAEGAFVVLLHFGNLAAEGCTVLGGDGKVQVDSAIATFGVEGTLYDVLLKGGALYGSVAVEFQQGFGQASVAEVLLLEQEVDDGAVVAAVEVVLDVEVGGCHLGFQVVEESKGVDVFQEGLHLWELLAEVARNAEVGGGETVKVFEHARGSSRGGDELQQFLAVAKGAVLFFVARYFLVA